MTLSTATRERSGRPRRSAARFFQHLEFPMTSRLAHRPFRLAPRRTIAMFGLALPALGSTSCALEVEPPATAPASAAAPAGAISSEAALLRFQIAVDQLAAGNPVEARVVLEDLVRKAGDRLEWNVLLASLLEREGKAARARQVLARVQNSSSVARALATRLQGQPDGAPARTSAADDAANKAGGDDEGGEENAARSAVADERLARLEQGMLALVNQERERAGLGALVWNERLAQTARAHSVEMRDRKYFSHDSPTPALRRPMNRYKAGMGATPRLVAENIYRAWGSRNGLGPSDIQEGHRALMDSPGHRANILLSQVQRCGIGIAVNENGDIWLTQMFDRP
jgi:uncharacterized protein YkwD